MFALVLAFGLLRAIEEALLQEKAFASLKPQPAKEFEAQLPPVPLQGCLDFHGTEQFHPPAKPWSAPDDPANRAARKIDRQHKEYDQLYEELSQQHKEAIDQLLFWRLMAAGLVALAAALFALGTWFGLRQKEKDVLASPGSWITRLADENPVVFAFILQERARRRSEPPPTGGETAT